MKVDLCASHAHYRDHTMPIWEALPDELRGEAFDSPRFRPKRSGNLTLVAGRADVQAMEPNKVILVEHGAGQTYSGFVSLHNVGSVQPPHVVAYIGPGQSALDKWEGANPGRPGVAVGCPRMDKLLRERPKPEPRTVAVAFRWNVPAGKLIPEQLPALAHYAEALGRLVELWRAQGWTVIGHGHPRARKELTVLWRSVGVRPTWDADEVLSRASLLIMDTSSLMYEAASLHRVVIAMNAPWYRRDVEHGLRFWSHVPGRQVDSPDELAAIDLDLAVNDYDSAVLRQRAAEHVYAYTDGHAAERAAAFVSSLVDSCRAST